VAISAVGKLAASDLGSQMAHLRAIKPNLDHKMTLEYEEKSCDIDFTGV
jgi:hypothetical protein